MPDILDRILEVKRDEVRKAKAEISQGVLFSEIAALGKNQRARSFLRAIRHQHRQHNPAVIAEIKRASPSKGLLRDPFDPVEIARDYATCGAACLSVLTDAQFFQGSADHLKVVRAHTSLPILRKDFVIDPYQVAEARHWGADCVLLIVSALTDGQLNELFACAVELDLDVLIEVHNEEELARALKLSVSLIGINNRNLRTFETDLNTTLRLQKLLPPDRIPVTESGIHSRADVAHLRRHGIETFLVGEAFMRSPSPGNALKELFFTAQTNPGSQT